MTAPVWVTPPGDLGTIVEGEFYQIQLSASNADTFSYLSGILPAGIRVTSNGIVEGAPKNYEFIQGVPTEVNQDVTSKFVVRATSNDGTVADRVFEMTVTGQDAPKIDATPAADLGAYFDGNLVNVQLTVTDPDPGDTHTWSHFSGNLPAGVTVSSTGLINGYIEPFPISTGTAGFDNNKFDTENFDFRTISENRFYEFTVQVTDGKDIDTKTYSLFAVSRSILTADIDIVTADNDSSALSGSTLENLLDASQSSLRSPALLTASDTSWRVDHDNHFNFQFVGKDFDGDTLEYVTTGTLPPGLTLNSTTGWLSGYIPQTFSTETDYSFTVQVRKQGNTDFVSNVVSFKITIVGDIDSVITWPTSDLGTIQTGQVSELDVIATISDGRPVQYELKSGANNKLPQGLTLNDNGLIIGRVSFENMMFDTGSTTFDKNTSYINETTFESKYAFTVRVFSADGIINTSQAFTVAVNRLSNDPYENVYAKAFAPSDQRDIYDSLVQNIDDIPADDVYRSTDFNFGIKKDLKAIISAGLNTKPLTDYIEATSKNFYNNTLRFNGFKTAQALDSAGNVRYEVVYIELVDNVMGINPTTKLSGSPALRQDLRSATTWQNPITTDEGWPKVSAGHYMVSQANNYYAYPNSIVNMRSRLGTDIGHNVLERKVLPSWMVDKQSDDTSLGWVLACPVVFCNPGTSAKIKYRLEQRTSLDLKKISFEVDRLILDNNLSTWYNSETGKYKTTQETSFDISITVTTFDGDGTRFFADIDVFGSEDENDSYIKFPQVGVFR